MSVSAVGVNLTAGDDVRVIDARGKLVIPGEMLFLSCDVYSWHFRGGGNFVPNNICFKSSGCNTDMFTVQ